MTASLFFVSLFAGLSPSHSVIVIKSVVQLGRHRNGSIKWIDTFCGLKSKMQKDHVKAGWDLLRCKNALTIDFGVVAPEE